MHACKGCYDDLASCTCCSQRFDTAIPLSIENELLAFTVLEARSDAILVLMRSHRPFNLHFSVSLTSQKKKKKIIIARRRKEKNNH